MVIKKAGLGVVDDELKKKRKKKTYIKKAFDYLFSDDYMFAPLLSSSHNFSPSTSSLGAGIEESSSAKVGKEKDFVEKVGDYFKCDCYLYSPLVITQPWLNSSISAHAAPTQRGLVGLLEKKSDEDLLKEASDNDKITRDKPSLPVEKIAISSVSNKERDRSTVMKRQTVKHIIFQNCDR